MRSLMTCSACSAVHPETVTTKRWSATVLLPHRPNLGRSLIEHDPGDSPVVRPESPRLGDELDRSDVCGQPVHRSQLRVTHRRLDDLLGDAQLRAGQVEQMLGPTLDDDSVAAVPVRERDDRHAVLDAVLVGHRVRPRAAADLDLRRCDPLDLAHANTCSPLSSISTSTSSHIRAASVSALPAAPAWSRIQKPALSWLRVRQKSMPICSQPWPVASWNWRISRMLEVTNSMTSSRACTWASPDHGTDGSTIFDVNTAACR